MNAENVSDIFNKAALRHFRMTPYSDPLYRLETNTIELRLNGDLMSYKDLSACALSLG